MRSYHRTVDESYYKNGISMASSANKGQGSDEEPPKWGYLSENGPHVWSKYYPAGLGGQQSPVDIDQSSACVRFDGTLTALKMTYDPFSARTLRNTGRSFQINFDEEAENVLHGGPLLNDKYNLVQIHAHWSPKNDRGSEHTVNGRAYAAEVHFVHYNKEKYGNFNEAVQHGDGLAVLGVFLKIGQRHAALQKLVDEFNRIRYCDQEVIMNHSPVDVAALMPSDTSRYWTYQGSLTTPPLMECVTWIVFEMPVEVSADQLQQFRELSRVTINEKASNCNQSLDNNYRPTMPINGRVVRASFRN